MSGAGRGPSGRAGGGDARRPAAGDRAKEHWLVRPASLRRIKIVSVIVLALTVLPDLFVEQHAAFGVEDAFGFYAAYGFLACVAMVLVAKALGAALKRGDRYYD